MSIKYLFLASAFILVGCAQQMTPQGGPKDETSPKIKKSEPLNYSTKFEGNGIKITYDEYVTISSIQSEYLLSPPMENELEFKLKGKSLLVTFPDSLKSNTTYLLNFGEGVKDYHEGNVLDSSVFVFSTGNYLDSNRIKGMVKNAFDLSEVEKVQVMLYESSEDSTPAKSRPYYYAKTKKDGSFDLNHLKDGDFQIFVLEDKNSNSIYDLPNERIGFLDFPISSSNPDSSVIIHLFQEDRENQYVLKSNEERYGKMVLAFNQPLKKLIINILDSNFNKPWFQIDYSKTNDTVTLWNDLGKFGSQSLKLALSDNDSILDTISIKLAQFPKEYQKIQPKLSSSITSGMTKYFEPIRFKWSSPIVSFQENAITIVQGLDTIKPKYTQLSNMEFEVDYRLEEEKNYSFIINDSTFVDYLGLYNDSGKFDFKTKSSIQYANLNLTIKELNGSSFYMEFMTAEGKTIEKILFKDERIFKFKNVDPGKYKIKLTFDENGNEKWDPGTFIPRKLPERVIYFSGEIEIKEGWDKELEWIIPH
ncbi:MAG: Ig-like domain-containing protein [Flavobacteriales bacterium]|nr:Ig-like domain-containing protein [Flavobacteriales bacterium]